MLLPVFSLLYSPSLLLVYQKVESVYMTHSDPVILCGLLIIVCTHALDSELDPTLLGLALVYSLVVSNTLQYVIRQNAEVENIVSFIAFLPLSSACL